MIIGSHRQHLRSAGTVANQNLALGGLGHHRYARCGIPDKDGPGGEAGLAGPTITDRQCPTNPGVERDFVPGRVVAAPGIGEVLGRGRGLGKPSGSVGSGGVYHIALGGHNRRRGHVEVIPEMRIQVSRQHNISAGPSLGRSPGHSKLLCRGRCFLVSKPPRSPLVPSSG